MVPIISGDRRAICLKIAVGAANPIDALARSHGYGIKNGQSLLIDMADERLWNGIAGLRFLGAQAGLSRRLHKLDMANDPSGNGSAGVAPAERVLLLITPQIVELEEEEERPKVDR